MNLNRVSLSEIQKHYRLKVMVHLHWMPKRGEKNHVLLTKKEDHIFALNGGCF